jgi:hypothetical protein
MHTYILIQAMPTADLTELMREVAPMSGIELAEAVTGPYDLIVKARNEEARGILAALAELDGVLRVIDAPIVGARGREPAAA